MLTLVIEFNLGTIFAFIAGILSGAVLLFLLYLFLMAVYMKRKGKIEPPFDGESKIDEVHAIIKTNQKKFKDLCARQSGIDLNLFKDLNYDVMVEVARLYYPESKNPLGELSISQLEQLNSQLPDAIDGLLKKFKLSFLKEVKLSKLISIVNAKKQIDENEVIKKTKFIGKYGKTFWNILNIINPVMWIKKGIISPSISLFVHKICLYTIETVAIKTNNVFSGESFTTDLTDEENEEFLNEFKDMMHDDNIDTSEQPVQEESEVEIIEKPSKLHKIKNLFKRKEALENIPEPVILKVESKDNQKKTRN